MTVLKRSPLKIRRNKRGVPVHARVCDQLLEFLATRKEEGVGSWELAAAGFSNPSMAAKELAMQLGVSWVRERPPNASPQARGVRYFLASFAPAEGARAVRPAKGKHPAPAKSSAFPRAEGDADGAPRRPRPARSAPSAPPSLSVFDVLAAIEADSESHHSEAQRRAA